MFNLVVAAAFQQIAEADQVGLDVGIGVLQRISHAGLAGQVDDAVEFLGGEQVFYHDAVGNVAAHELEVWVGLELLQARQLEFGIVVVVEVVDADHFITPLEQDLGDMHADETGGSGDEDFHGCGPCIWLVGG